MVTEMRSVTPHELEILLFYYYSAADYRNGDYPPATKLAIERFLEAGLLTHQGFCIERFDDGNLRSRWSVTEKGRAYVEAILSMPFPEQIWVVPAQPERKCALTSGTGK
jgi:hypothetical protein